MFVTHFPTEKTALMSTSLREEKKKGEKENGREEKNRLLALNTTSVYSNTQKGRHCCEYINFYASAWT